MNLVNASGVYSTRERAEAALCKALEPHFGPVPIRLEGSTYQCKHLRDPEDLNIKEFVLDANEF